MLDEDSPERAPLPKTKWRPGCVTYFIVALLLIGFGIWGGYALWKQSLARQLEAEIAARRARGEPIWFSDLKPESLPPEENGLTRFRAAMNLWELRRQPDSQDNYPATRVYLENARDFHDLASLTNAQHDELRAMLAENQEVLAIVRQAIAKPVVQVDYDYSEPHPWDVILDEMDAASKFRELLLAQAAVKRLDGDLDHAAATLGDLLRLSYLFRDEFFLVSQYVRRRIEADAIEELSRILAAGPISQESIQALDDILQQLETVTRGRHIVLAETAMAFTTLSNATPAMFAEIRGLSYGMNESDSFREQAYFQFDALRLRELLKLLDAMEGFADLADEVGKDANAQMAALEEEYLAEMSDAPIIEEYDLLPGLPGLRESLLTHRQLLINGRLALRVARYYRTRGSLPQTLEAVVDEDFPRVEVGLLSQQPLIYRVFDDGLGPCFEIYDVGQDEIDNHAADGHREEQGSRVVVRFEQNTTNE